MRYNCITVEDFTTYEDDFSAKSLSKLCSNKRPECSCFGHRVMVARSAVQIREFLLFYGNT